MRLWSGKILNVKIYLTRILVVLMWKITDVKQDFSFNLHLKNRMFVLLSTNIFITVLHNISSYEWKPFILSKVFFLWNMLLYNACCNLPVTVKNATQMSLLYVMENTCIIIQLPVSYSELTNWHHTQERRLYLDFKKMKSITEPMININVSILQVFPYNSLDCWCVFGVMACSVV